MTSLLSREAGAAKLGVSIPVNRLHSLTPPFSDRSASCRADRRSDPTPNDIAALMVSAAQADGPDISAQRLLDSWKDDDPGMRMVAEVIASAFASGFSWGGDVAGKHAYCASPDLKGRLLSAFEGFLKDNPKVAADSYGAAMAATLGRAFPCRGQ